MRPLTRLAGRRLELWVEARDGAPAVNPVLRALLEDLAGAGAEVRVRVPEAEVVAACVPGRGERPDLVLLKTPGALALSLATAVEASGVPCLNPAPATLRAQDKAATVARLAAVGLPVPATFLSAGSGPGAESSAVDRSGAWVSKPVRGVHGLGVAFHGSFREAVDHREAPRPARDAGYVVDDGTRLVQRRVGAGEPDLKVYVAGREVFAGAKPFGPRSYREDAITPCPLSAAQRELVLAAGEALGLRLFGVDLRAGAAGPALVDVNPFPGYRGFPAAVPALRREVQRALREAGR